MPKIGDKVCFTPTAFLGEDGGRRETQKMSIPRTVTGRICYINERHRYYTAEYEVHGYKLKESIKF